MSDKCPQHGLEREHYWNDSYACYFTITCKECIKEARNKAMERQIKELREEVEKLKKMQVWTPFGMISLDRINK